MTIPTYEELLLPFLELIRDKNEYKIKDVIKGLIPKFNLTEEEINLPVAEGKEPKFNNRVYFARLHLIRALLIESPSRGIVKITERGLYVLKSNPKSLNLKDLMKFDEYREYRHSLYKTKTQDTEEQDIEEQISYEEETELTPEEAMSEAYNTIMANLALNLLDIIKNSEPEFFEKLVLKVLSKMGYGGPLEDLTQHVGKSHDEGIDGIIKQDILGLDVIYIQAKRWSSTVGRPEIQKFYGAIADTKTKKGVFITTSSFSKEAREYAKNKKIVLITGWQLAKFMINYNIGVKETDSYIIKDIDTDFFEE